MLLYPIREWNLLRGVELQASWGPIAPRCYILLCLANANSWQLLFRWQARCVQPKSTLVHKIDSMQIAGPVCVEEAAGYRWLTTSVPAILSYPIMPIFGCGTRVWESVIFRAHHSGQQLRSSPQQRPCPPPAARASAAVDSRSREVDAWRAASRS